MDTGVPKRTVFRIGAIRGCFRLIFGSEGWRAEGVYGKDMISVQATACTENQGITLLV